MIFDRTKPLEKILLQDGYFGVGKFISLSRALQKNLLEIVDLVHNYSKRSKMSRPLNIYIEALPGSGKSFFVKQICKAVEDSLSGREFCLLTFNITNMKSTNEILSALHRVQSLNIEGTIPIVFFDEIDSKINGIEDAYPHFLSPMFDGKIYENGNEFRIGSAVFFFAASNKTVAFMGSEEESIATKDEKEIAEPQSYLDWIKNERESYDDAIKKWKSNNSTGNLPKKIIDFRDRIDSVVFIPPTNINPDSDGLVNLKEQSQLIVCAMLLRYFPAVRFIDKRALGLLSLQVMSGNSMRNSESYIFKSSPPIDNYFRFLNLPIDFREKYQNEAANIKEGVIEIIQ